MKQHDEPTPYAQLGGEAGVRSLVARFYKLMDQSAQFAAVRALHSADLSRASNTLFEFLSGWLGGPSLYFQKPQHRCVISSHFKFAIGIKEANQWLACMAHALTQTDISEALRERLNHGFSAMAEKMRSSPH